MCTVGSHPMVNHMSSSGFNTRLRPQTFSWQAYTQMTVGVSHVREAHTIRLSSFLKPRTSLDMGSSSGEYRYGGVLHRSELNPRPYPRNARVRTLTGQVWVLAVHSSQSPGHRSPSLQTWRPCQHPSWYEASSELYMHCLSVSHCPGMGNIMLPWLYPENAIAIDIHPQTMPLSYQ